MGQLRSIGLAFALCASAAAAATPEAPYRAFGSDSDWTLTIEKGRMTFERPGEPTISAPAPTRRDGEPGWEYRTRELSVHSLPGSCEDESSGRRYSEAVFITLKGKELAGCGGAEIPAGSLADTAWMIQEIAGTPARGPELSMDFNPGGSFLAYTGCRRLGGTWAQSGDTLTVTVTGGTTGRCGEPAAGCERRLLRIIAGPMKIALPERRTLLLTGDSGSIRLRDPTPEEDIFKTEFSPCPALDD